MKKPIVFCFFGFVASAIALLGTGSAVAQLNNPFAGSSGSLSGQSATANLPPCPPSIDGARSSVWEPGVNCTLQGLSGGRAQATAYQNIPATAGTAIARGAPLDTLGTGLGASNPTDQSQPTLPGQVPQVEDVGVFSGDQVRATLEWESALDQVYGRIGLSYSSWPDYRGADLGAERGTLLFDLTLGRNGFLNNADGLGWRVLTFDSLESKISVNWNGAQVFRGDTEGLKETSNHLNLELDIVYTGLDRSYELEWTKPLNGLSGWTLALSTELKGAFDTFGTWDARLGLTYASAPWMKSYYSISADESNKSGLAPYDPGSGLFDVFLETSLDVPLGINWGLDLGVSVRRMMGPAAEAPQVKDAGSALDYSGRVGFYYLF